ncbi:MAG: hypothetical protein ACXW2C_04730 [Acidimicrobiia bacterium]
MLADTVIDVVLIACGVIAIVVAIIWRTGSRRRQISRFTRLLVSTDPQRRAEAAIGLTELGLDRSARVLLEHARVETDPDVRICIAAAVARRQWEPGGPPGVAPLREWAATELATHGYNVTNFGPATTRLADMGGPRLEQAGQSIPPDATIEAPPPAVVSPDAGSTDVAAGGAA